jgi:hypothetical protein
MERTSSGAENESPARLLTIKIKKEKTGFNQTLSPKDRQSPIQNGQTPARSARDKTPNTSILLNPNSPLIEGNEMQPPNTATFSNCTDLIRLYQTKIEVQTRKYCTLWIFVCTNYVSLGPNSPEMPSLKRKMISDAR